MDNSLSLKITLPVKDMPVKTILLKTVLLKAGLLKIMCLSIFLSLFASVSLVHAVSGTPQNPAQVYSDKAFLQDYALKYPLQTAATDLHQVRSDRNGVVQVLSSQGLLRPAAAALATDNFYRPLSAMNILALESYQQQFIYLTDKAVLSNAWAGKFFVQHDIPEASHLAMGPTFSFMLAAAGELAYFQDGKAVWKKQLGDFAPLELLYNEAEKYFLILEKNHIYRFDITEQRLKKVYKGDALTAMTIDGDSLLIGTSDGFLSLNKNTFKAQKILNRALPWPEITAIKNINGQLWFGSHRGAFSLKAEGGFNYYASKRWLLDDDVLDIQPGPDGSVLILTQSGLSQIAYREMTLADKAAHFEKIQRQRHIRYGFSSEVRLKTPGDLSSATLVDTDNDGLWTSMYLAAELFRYAATQSDDALRNAYEAFEAMEQLELINPLDGFPSRTYEREGFPVSDNVLDADGEPIWRLTEDGRWRWKSTTSSDESCGHFFVYALFAELVPDPAWKARAVTQIKRQMDHLIDNDWYLVSWNGKPTEWGRFNPDYVNKFPINVGDRRLNSTLMLTFLQTAFHFTGEARYQDKAAELIEKHGYQKNVLRPASMVRFVEGEVLSDVWNHSDDEMYFLTAPALYKYAYSEQMQKAYAKTVKSHWQEERSEGNPLWNFIYAMSGGEEVDLEASVEWLQEFPLDLIDWSVSNSHRKDLEFLKPNFRGQKTTQLLPPDERPLHLHNKPNYYNDADGGARQESPPYIYLLPYWMGRYVGAIQPES